MQKTEEYYFHQTPEALAKDLIATLDIKDDDVLYDAFKGEGAFYNHFPLGNQKDWSEIIEGRDFQDYKEEYDWVITNPPFRLETGKNSFWFILKYFMDRSRKGIAFLANDVCFATLTPKRISEFQEMGWNLTSIHVCSVKKWRGRYFFIVFQKIPCHFFKCLTTNY
jgi:hypothetical protein